MIPRISRAPHALLAVVLAAALSCAKDSPTGPETQIIALTVIPEVASAAPSSAVTLTVRGATIPAAGLSAEMGSTAVTIGRLTDSTAALLVPVLAAGSATLRVSFTGAAGSVPFTIVASAPVANPDAFLDSTSANLRAQLTTFTDLDSATLAFASARLATLDADLAALTPAERANAAMAIRNAAAELAAATAIPALRDSGSTSIVASVVGGCACGGDGSTLEDCTSRLTSPEFVALKLGFGAAAIAEGVAIGSASGPNLYGKAVGGAIAGLGVWAILKTYNDTMCQSFQAIWTGFSADEVVVTSPTSSQIIGLGTYFSDTAYRLNVMGRYQSASVATRSKNLYAGFVMDALGFLEAIWEDIRAKFPSLPNFAGIPQTPSVSLVQRIPSKYLLLGPTTPSAVSGSAETRPDSTWWVKFSLPGIGNLHPFDFVVEYTGPGAVNTETDYSATLRPDTFPVASVEIVGGDAVIGVQIDASRQLEAILLDSVGRVITDRLPTWTSSIPATATVSSTGLVYGVKEGVTTVRAVAELQSDDATVLVGPIPVDTVVLSPDTLTLGIGGDGRFNVTLLDSLNRVLTGRVVTWQSLDTTIVKVNAETGLFTGVIGGVATVRATSEGKSTVAAVKVINAARLLSTGSASRHHCAVTTGGAIVCWGSNSSGQLGDSTATTTSTAVVSIAASNDALQIVTGAEHSCARYADGSVQCWGLNDIGQLGNGRESPYEVPATLVTGGLNFSKIAAGPNSTCGITTVGQAYCWGAMFGTTTSVPTPVGGGNTFTDITTGGNDGACGLTSGGSILCWGQIGWSSASSPSYSATPILVGGNRSYTKLAASRLHQCGLSGGTIYCWGEIDAEAAGIASYPRPTVPDSNDYSEYRGVPFPVSANAAFSDVVAGARFGCGLSTSGTVYCWGTLTQDPVNPDPDGSVPLAGVSKGTHMPGDGAMLQDLAGGNFTALGTSRSTVCGLKNGGIPWCWGSSYAGQTGQGKVLGTFRGSSTPAPIEEPTAP